MKDITSLLLFWEGSLDGTVLMDQGYREQFHLFLHPPCSHTYPCVYLLWFRERAIGEVKQYRSMITGFTSSIVAVISYQGFLNVNNMFEKVQFSLTKTVCNFLQHQLNPHSAMKSCDQDFRRERDAFPAILCQEIYSCWKNTSNFLELSFITEDLGRMCSTEW